MARQWVYRPTDAEHELLLKAMEQNPEYGSIAQFIREAVLRLAHDSDRRRLYTQVGELIDELGQLKEKFLRLVIEHSEEL